MSPYVANIFKIWAKFAESGKTLSCAQYHTLTHSIKGEIHLQAVPGSSVGQFFLLGVLVDCLFVSV